MNTQNKISVAKAVQSFNWVLALPLTLIMALLALAVFLGIKEIIHPLVALIGWLLIGFPAIGVLYYIALAKWRIWAYNAVSDMHELHALETLLPQLGLEVNSFNYSINSKADKEKLKDIVQKVSGPNIYVDDLSVPDVTNIYYNRRKRYIWAIVFLIAIALSIAGLLMSDSPHIFGVLIIMLFIPAIYNYRLTRDKTVKITLSNEGIETYSAGFHKWVDVSNEDVTRIWSSRNKWYELVFSYPGGKEAHDIADFNIHYLQMKHLLSVYRMRYTQKKQPS